MEQKVELLERVTKIVFFQKGCKMRIAICDSDSHHLKTLKNSLYKFSNQKKFEFLVDEFQSGEALLNSKINYCLIFLDYALPKINGLEAAKRLKEADRNTSIVFLSGDTHFVFEAFKVNTYRFLTKPFCEETLFKTLEEFFSEYTMNHPLWVSNGIETICLNIGDIVYLEADNKHCNLHLKDMIIPCNKTMAKVFSVLPKAFFEKINRSFIVNLNYITSYNNDSVFLKNGESLHISRSYTKSFKDGYINFSNPKMP